MALAPHEAPQLGALDGVRALLLGQGHGETEYIAALPAHFEQSGIVARSLSKLKQAGRKTAGSSAGEIPGSGIKRFFVSA